jgi:hypothetical protein
MKLYDTVVTGLQDRIKLLLTKQEEQLLTIYLKES